VAGCVAGAVAREVRKHVNAALREAETKRQMERLEHDMKVARSIQLSLLPSNTPAIKGFDVAGWNLAADETGGDFYDWQQFPNGKLLVVLADVTGHGLGPAILAAVCRAYARASFSVQDDLLAAMRRINTALSQDLTPGRFATLVAAICTPDNSRVELLSAGHGPLFIYLLREDRFDAMGAQGLPLGIMPDLNSDPPQYLDLNPGDLLVLATDGLYEWENGLGEQFGAQRLEQAIRRVRESQPQEIIQTLYKAVLDFSGGTKQQDDLTMVIIKRTH
jgi:serine phosphatase RsbU (regulator of sigma subunit)